MELPNLTYRSYEGEHGETVLELDKESAEAYNRYLMEQKMARLALGSA